MHKYNKVALWILIRSESSGLSLTLVIRKSRSLRDDRVMMCSVR